MIFFASRWLYTLLTMGLISSWWADNRSNTSTPTEITTCNSQNLFSELENNLKVNILQNSPHNHFYTSKPKRNGLEYGTKK